MNPNSRPPKCGHTYCAPFHCRFENIQPRGVKQMADFLTAHPNEVVIEPRDERLPSYEPRDDDTAPDGRPLR